MLFDQDARGEGCDGVSIEHGHRRLKKDRAAIELCGDEVHGHATHPNAMVERLTLRVEARE